MDTIIDLALKNHALRFGTFTLKSGRKSPYFFDIGHLLQCSHAWWQLSHALAEKIRAQNWGIQCLFGPAYKGIPLATATACAWQQLGFGPLHIAADRKELKTHGEGGHYIGLPPQGRIAIIDDVMTAGTAIQNAHRHIQASTATLAGICIVFDRQEAFVEQGACSTLEHIQTQLQRPIISLFNLDDLIAYTSKRHHLAEQTEILKTHRATWTNTQKTA